MYFDTSGYKRLSSASDVEPQADRSVLNKLVVVEGFSCSGLDDTSKFPGKKTAKPTC